MEERGTRTDMPMKPQVVDLSAEQAARRRRHRLVRQRHDRHLDGPLHPDARRHEVLPLRHRWRRWRNGLPYSIGAAVAYPGRQVVCVVGDGGFTMMMGEMATLVKYKLPVKVIIIKNNVLGQIKWEQMVFEGNPEFGVELQPIDFAVYRQELRRGGLHARRSGPRPSRCCARRSTIRARRSSRRRRSERAADARTCHDGAGVEICGGAREGTEGRRGRSSRPSWRTRFVKSSRRGHAVSSASLPPMARVRQSLPSDHIADVARRREAEVDRLGSRAEDPTGPPRGHHRRQPRNRRSSRVPGRYRRLRSKRAAASHSSFPRWAATAAPPPKDRPKSCAASA